MKKAGRRGQGQAGKKRPRSNPEKISSQSAIERGGSQAAHDDRSVVQPRCCEHHRSNCVHSS